jgi:hypothetical protein
MLLLETNNKARTRVDCDSSPYWKADMRRTMFRHGKFDCAGGLNRNRCVRGHLCSESLERTSPLIRATHGVAGFHCAAPPPGIHSRNKGEIGGAGAEVLDLVFIRRLVCALDQARTP